MAGSSAGRPDKMSLAPRADSWRESCSPTAAAAHPERREGEEGRIEREGKGGNRMIMKYEGISGKQISMQAKLYRVLTSS